MGDARNDAGLASARFPCYRRFAYGSSDVDKSITKKKREKNKRGKKKRPGGRTSLRRRLLETRFSIRLPRARVTAAQPRAHGTAAAAAKRSTTWLHVIIIFAGRPSACTVVVFRIRRRYRVLRAKFANGGPGGVSQQNCIANAFRQTRKKNKKPGDQSL